MLSLLKMKWKFIHLKNSRKTMRTVEFAKLKSIFDALWVFKEW